MKMEIGHLIYIFKLMLSILDFHDDFPGVIYPNQKDALEVGFVLIQIYFLMLLPLEENRKDKKIDLD